MLVIFLISILRSEWRATRGTIQVNQQPMKDLSNRIFLGRDGSTKPCTRLSPRIPHRGSVGVVHALSIKRECPHSPNPTSRQRGDCSSPFYKTRTPLHSPNPTSRQRGDCSCPFYKTRMPSLPQSHIAAAWGSFKSFL